MITFLVCLSVFLETATAFEKCRSNRDCAATRHCIRGNCMLRSEAESKVSEPPPNMDIDARYRQKNSKYGSDVDARYRQNYYQYGYDGKSAAMAKTESEVSEPPPNMDIDARYRQKNSKYGS